MWKEAQPATDFIQRDPDDGKPATERTEIRVLYDDNALYFGCMFNDSEPDKIVARLTRRDNEIESDRASIRIDSYHDHQTAYEFNFNAAGVKVDILQYDDANREDESWDPVWEVETRITPQGWVAEIKIPFQILRYRTSNESSDDNVWGINFIRYISRKQESERWAHTPKSQSGFISRFGHLLGLRGLPDPHRFETLPFVVGRQRYAPATSIMDRTKKFTPDAGLDLKYGVSSNFTIDATFNPDFGQVEADPAVLNLTTLETFYPERRPFFIEGTQIIRFTTFGGEFGPGMFYSRRIGRAISPAEIAVSAGGTIESIPQSTTILGAAKFSGKTNNGLSIGMLEAFTQEEKASVVDAIGNKSDVIVEPFAHYNVMRLKQDVLSNSNVGMIFTSVAKKSRLPAFANGYDWNLRFDENTYQLDGFLAFSHTTNSSRERISGSAGKIHFGKIAGVHWLLDASFDYTSNNYNINDIGFFFRPRDFGPVFTLTYKKDTPAEIVRNYNIGFTLHERRTFDGISWIREARVNSRILFSNYWGLRVNGGIDIGVYDDRETRGNGLYRKPHLYSANVGLFSDNRGAVNLQLNQSFSTKSNGGNGLGSALAVQVKPLTWMDWEIDAAYNRVRNEEAWTANIAAGTSTISIFGDRRTDAYNFTLRSTITFTRELTLQLYGQFFLAKGHYENFRQLIGTSDFVSYNYATNPDFNRLSFNTNVVLRWEYFPGSTLFLVWSQARSGSNDDYFTSFGNNLDSTFLIAPANVFLLKISFWWSL